MLGPRAIIYSRLARQQVYHAFMRDGYFMWLRFCLTLRSPGANTFRIPAWVVDFIVSLAMSRLMCHLDDRISAVSTDCLSLLERAEIVLTLVGL